MQVVLQDLRFAFRQIIRNPASPSPQSFRSPLA